MKTDDGCWITEFKEIKKHLQKSITILGQCHATFKAMDGNCKSNLDKVANLTEQYLCSSKVNASTLPMSAQFPDLKGKLLYKIGVEISEEMDHLKGNLSNLQACCESLTHQYEKSLQCYRRSTVVGDLPNITRKTPLYPSVSEMLLMLGSCERSLRESCLCKQFILDTYRPLEGMGEQEFQNTWSEGDRKLATQLEDCLAYTHHFMELKLT